MHKSLGLTSSTISLKKKKKDKLGMVAHASTPRGQSKEHHTIEI